MVEALSAIRQNPWLAPVAQKQTVDPQAQAPLVTPTVGSQQMVPEESVDLRLFLEIIGLIQVANERLLANRDQLSQEARTAINNASRDEVGGRCTTRENGNVVPKRALFRNIYKQAINKYVRQYLRDANLRSAIGYNADWLNFVASPEFTTEQECLKIDDLIRLSEEKKATLNDNALVAKLNDVIVMLRNLKIILQGDDNIIALAGYISETQILWANFSDEDRAEIVAAQQNGLSLHCGETTPSRLSITEILGNSGYSIIRSFREAYPQYRDDLAGFPDSVEAFNEWIKAASLPVRLTLVALDPPARTVIDPAQPIAELAPGEQIELTINGEYTDFPDTADILAPGITVIYSRVSATEVKLTISAAANVVPGDLLLSVPTGIWSTGNIDANDVFSVVQNPQTAGITIKIKPTGTVCDPNLLAAERALVCLGSGAGQDGGQGEGEGEGEEVNIDTSWRPRLHLGLGYLFPANSDNDQIGEASNAGSISLGGVIERNFDVSSASTDYALEAEAGILGGYRGTFGVEDMPDFGNLRYGAGAVGRWLGGDWAPTFRASLSGEHQWSDISTIANPSADLVDWQMGVSLPWGSLPFYIDLNYGGQSGTQNDGNTDSTWTRQMLGIAFGGKSEAFSGLLGYRYQTNSFALGYTSGGENLGGAGQSIYDGHGIYGGFFANLGSGWALSGEGGYDFMSRFADRYDASLTLRLPSDLWSTYLRLGFSNNHLQDLGDFQSYETAVGTSIPLGTFSRDGHWYTPDGLDVEVAVRTNDLDFDNPDFRSDTPVSVGLNLALRFGEQDPYIEQFGVSSPAAAAIYQNSREMAPASANGFVEIGSLLDEANEPTKLLFAALKLYSGFCPGADNKFEGLKAVLENNRFLMIYVGEWDDFVSALNTELESGMVGRAMLSMAYYLLDIDTLHGIVKLDLAQVQAFVEKIKAEACAPATPAAPTVPAPVIPTPAPTPVSHAPVMEIGQAAR